jgi:hypothetical protein
MGTEAKEGRDSRHPWRTWCRPGTGGCRIRRHGTTALLKAEEEVKSEVARMTREASERGQFPAQKQAEAARIRLSRELGGYLVCGGADPHNLKDAFYQQMKQSTGAVGDG